MLTIARTAALGMALVLALIACGNDGQRDAPAPILSHPSSGASASVIEKAAIASPPKDLQEAIQRAQAASGRTRPDMGPAVQAQQPMMSREEARAFLAQALQAAKVPASASAASPFGQASR
jgi:hypothetical protein